MGNANIRNSVHSLFIKGESLIYAFFSFLSSFLSAWRDYPAEINTVLGDRYVNLQLLGEGSYGMTYKCLDQKSGAVVALKQSRPSKGEYAEHLLRREKNILRRSVIRKFLNCWIFLLKTSIPILS